MRDEPDEDYRPIRRRKRDRSALYIGAAVALLGLVAAGVVAVALAKRPGETRTTGRPGEAPTVAKPDIAGTVDVDDVSKDYRTNEAGADGKYGGRRGTFTGDMHKLERAASGEWVMSFAIFMDGFNMRKGDVFAYFPASEGEKLAKLEYLSPLSFTGRCDGRAAGSVPRSVAIRDCRLVPRKK